MDAQQFEKLHGVQFLDVQKFHQLTDVEQFEQLHDSDTYISVYIPPCFLVAAVICIAGLSFDNSVYCGTVSKMGFSL